MKYNPVKLKKLSIADLHALLQLQPATPYTEYYKHNRYHIEHILHKKQEEISYTENELQELKAREFALTNKR